MTKLDTQAKYSSGTKNFKPMAWNHWKWINRLDKEHAKFEKQFLNQTVKWGVSINSDVKYYSEWTWCLR